MVNLTQQSLFAPNIEPENHSKQSASKNKKSNQRKKPESNPKNEIRNPFPPSPQVTKPPSQAVHLNQDVDSILLEKKKNNRTRTLICTLYPSQASILELFEPYSELEGGFKVVWKEASCVVSFDSSTIAKRAYLATLHHPTIKINPQRRLKGLEEPNCPETIPGTNNSSSSERIDKSKPYQTSTQTIKRIINRSIQQSS